MTWHTYQTTLTNKAWKKFGAVISENAARRARETKKVVAHLREKGLLVKTKAETEWTGTKLVIIWAKLPTLTKYEGRANITQKKSGETFSVAVSALAKTKAEAKQKVKNHLEDSYRGADHKKTKFELHEVGHGASRSFKYRVG